MPQNINRLKKLKKNIKKEKAKESDIPFNFIF